ncbi:MAG: cobyrinate a,c-diamide synthase [Proteobacteria bacterium]|nr:cobyrinate a,c-diamide synthase [Pseudomonadota bacterium]
MQSESPPAFLIAAPSSGSGKTVLTLALLRAFHKRGITVGSFKVGPDYIDPVFHHRASGRPCFNLDIWAMREGTQSAVLSTVFNDNRLIIGEGVMGLFDGARDGSGSTADIASQYDLPIILVVDARGQSTSAGAVLTGFNSFKPSIKIAGVIFNKTGGPGHIQMLRDAADQAGIPALGFIPRTDSLGLDHRHLGLVQARENVDLERFLEKASEVIEAHVDLDGMLSLAQKRTQITKGEFPAILPLGQKIAVAEDDAFSFTYPHILGAWKNAGVELSFFSPLADQVPSTEADAIYLPGGYPELYCEKLSNAENFRTGMRKAAEAGTAIYGECGGFMVLGESLTAKDSRPYPMLNLLPIQTSFAEPKLHLGYRNATIVSNCILGVTGSAFKAHEFHYAMLSTSESVSPLFSLSDALGKDIGVAGAFRDNITGSFIHIIDRIDD